MREIEIICPKGHNLNLQSNHGCSQTSDYHDTYDIVINLLEEKLIFWCEGCNKFYKIKIQLSWDDIYK